MTPGTVWLTGLPASGKSTLALALSAALVARGHTQIVLLDGEHVRATMQPPAGHGLTDRERVLCEIVERAARALDAGQTCIVATISHKRAMRDHARERLGRMLEVFLDCPPSICAARDAKGHYARALAGDPACFVGVTEAYEAGWPDLTIDTRRLPPRRAAERLLDAAAEFLQL